jgi:WhiB family transcriptional regulator, redox-sensing transcriptional regulator
MLDAACLGVDPEKFFPGRGKAPREALEVCEKCIVQQECRAFAESNDVEHGVWGGRLYQEKGRPG